MPGVALVVWPLGHLNVTLFLQFYEPPYHLSNEFLFSLCLPESTPVICNHENLSNRKTALGWQKDPSSSVSHSALPRPTRQSHIPRQPLRSTYHTPKSRSLFPLGLCIFCSSFQECHLKMIPIHHVGFSPDVTSSGKFSRGPSEWSLMLPQGLVKESLTSQTMLLY